MASAEIKKMTYSRFLPYFYLFSCLAGCAQLPVSDGGLDPNKAAIPLASSPDSLAHVPAVREQKWSVETDHFVAVVAPPVAQYQPPKRAGNLWAELRSRYALPAQHQVVIEREARWFAKNPAYLQRIFERSRPYLYHIHEKAEKMGVPGEIVLLPVVESAFRAQVSSSSGAAGLWQFMPKTGQIFGLRQDWWYDGRRDVQASTSAALLYLHQLQKRFKGDWLLALASYNAGPGTVSRAITRNREQGLGTDFWSLQLPAETRAYVPKLLAISRIVKNPKRYGIKLPAIADYPTVSVVATKGPIELGIAAKLAGLPEAQLRALNPGFKRWATPPKGPHQLLLPNERVADFQAGLLTLSPEKRLRWASHRVSKGDSLGRIAKRYGTTITALRKINGIKGGQIYVGRRLVIPVDGLSIAKVSPSAVSFKPKKRIKRKKATIHTVQSGDTLWGLAKNYRVGMKQLASWNGLAPDAGLRTGQRLTIHSKKRDSTIHYTVRQGDSLNRISRQFKVSVRDLRRWNPTAKTGKHIHPGQRLKVIVGSKSRGI